MYNMLSLYIYTYIYSKNTKREAYSLYHHFAALYQNHQMLWTVFVRERARINVLFMYVCVCVWVWARFHVRNHQTDIECFYHPNESITHSDESTKIHGRNAIRIDVETGCENERKIKSMPTKCQLVQTHCHRRGDDKAFWSTATKSKKEKKKKRP